LTRDTQPVTLEVREDDVIETIAGEFAEMTEVYTECLCRFRHRDLRPAAAQ
jgi:hypothetical protein